MDYVIILIVMFTIIGLTIYYSTSKKQIEEIAEEEESIPTENILQLQDKTYRTQNKYNNMAQNQRTDAIIKELSKIHFWLVIIGIYIITKVAICIIIIATKGIIISELMQLILKNFSNDF